MTAGVQGSDFTLLFRARRRLCAMPLAHVLETMRPLAVTPLAAMPAFVLGLAFIRGAAIPVVDAGAVLGDAAVPQATRFVALRLGERRAALAVEAVLGVREVPRALLQQMPPLLHEAGEELVSHVGTLDNELLLVLSAGRILTDAAESALDMPGTPA